METPLTEPTTTPFCDALVLPHGADLPLPTYQTDGAAGMDLYAAIPRDKPVTINRNGRALIPCGFCVALPAGYEGQIRARSGLAKNYGVAVLNAPGTIDSDYRGEIGVLLINLGQEQFVVHRGERIGQFVISPVVQMRLRAVDALPETARGTGGFGHTGRG